MKICIDIGHANGTGASAAGYSEHEICAFIASALEDVLTLFHHSVDIIDFPNESNSVDLRRTVEAANAGNYDLGISLHCDASDNPDARGAHVCYISAAGKVYADAIAGELCKRMPGRAQKTVKRSDLYVLKHTRAPWVLVECGFITNALDRASLIYAGEEIAGDIAVGLTILEKREKGELLED